jgi:uncharacterized damage-inducible protein DinB
MIAYDLWANLRWFPLCFEEPMRGVMTHILRAQVIWLERCGGQTSFHAADPYDFVDALSLAWSAHIEETDLNELVTYRNSMGIKYSEPRLDIIRHVINHGSYHRGQLRAMAEMMAVPAFPETDYILYLREQGN